MEHCNFPTEGGHAEQVKGKRLDLDTGIRTRSRAAAQQEQFEAVPAPVQIFALLADMLIEAREGTFQVPGCHPWGTLSRESTKYRALCARQHV